MKNPLYHQTIVMTLGLRTDAKVSSQQPALILEDHLSKTATIPSIDFSIRYSKFMWPQQTE